MSVYTRVTEDDLRALLAEYSIGELEDWPANHIRKMLPPKAAHWVWS